jgi:hypothetical protein
MRLPIALILLAGLGLFLGCGAAAAEAVPLPRPRPPLWTEPHSFAEAVAGLDFNAAAVSGAPTPCDRRLQAEAAVALLPRLIGPGVCGNGDLVELASVILPDKTRIAVEPAAVLTCPMAESLAGWLRDDAAPSVAKLGSALRVIENYDSYECRSRNRVPGARISEHAHGEAIDVRAFHLADGRRLELTDPTVDLPLRLALRDSACHRFTTVLGPGADPYHGGHIHLDIEQRHGGYRICEWDVREPATVGSTPVPLPLPRPIIANAR